MTFQSSNSSYLSSEVDNYNYVKINGTKEGTGHIGSTFQKKTSKTSLNKAFTTSIADYTIKIGSGDES